MCVCVCVCVCWNRLHHATSRYIQFSLPGPNPYICMAALLLSTHFIPPAEAPCFPPAATSGPFKANNSSKSGAPNTCAWPRGGGRGGRTCWEPLRCGGFWRRKHTEGRPRSEPCARCPASQEKLQRTGSGTKKGMSFLSVLLTIETYHFDSKPVVTGQLVLDWKKMWWKSDTKSPCPAWLRRL